MEPLRPTTIPRSIQQDSIPDWNRCQIAPCLCRLFAKTGDKLRYGGRLMSDPELMERTGWGRTHLMSVYNAATWDHVTVGDMNLFLWACNISPRKQKKFVWKIRRMSVKGMTALGKMQHLRRDTPWKGNQVRLHLKMIERLMYERRRRSDTLRTGPAELGSRAIDTSNCGSGVGQ